MNLSSLEPQSVLFFMFAGICIGSALTVVLHRNPVVSAVSLVLSFFSLAGIYSVMNAIFIATMQVLVYAGAIMVLVVFVIMLLSLREETNQEIWRRPIKQSFIALLVITFGFLLIVAMNYSPELPNVTLPNGVTKGVYTYNLKTDGGATIQAVGNTATVGASTFIDYLLPFELVSVLLLAAVIGAVVIAKRDKLKNA